MWKKAHQDFATNPEFHADPTKTGPELAEKMDMQELLDRLEADPTNAELQRQVALKEELVRRMRDVIDKNQPRH